MNIAPQLAFAGECRQAFEFYARLMGGVITVMNTFGGNEDKALPPGSTAAAADQVRFAELSLGHSVLRGNDVPADQHSPMQGFNVSLHIEGADEARRIFAALSEGGTVTTPLAEVDWADLVDLVDLFGMVTDKFGVPWLVLAVKA
ncbi:MAG TPA: VOC family protein [Mesorhizobium sp.]|jgi:PhnB protein|uniref:VOC family protein n=1 Tax=Mesorhizobium sp. TaxID=1871066 RepID=UPI002DDC9838|nr:VOC family protein [Mesorhizobium sp.]HEV2505304.1 VOC family protein [Mesorhizobium sp.]